jgi:hypothetical protein
MSQSEKGNHRDTRTRAAICGTALQIPALGAPLRPPGRSATIEFKALAGVPREEILMKY